jgi:predicted  nucleic acid-binding Zn-ribbon protein
VTGVQTCALPICDQLEIFRIFKEIESHLKRIKQIEGEIDQENARLTHLKGKITESEDQLQELTTEFNELNTLEKKLAMQESQISVKLAKYENDLKMASNQSTADKLTEQVTIYKNELDQNQENALTALGRMDEITTESEDLKIFIRGASETLSEITNEVNAISEKSRNAIKTLQERIESLKTEFQDDANNVWERLKKRGHVERADFLARIEGANCNHCHCTLIRGDIDDVEVHKRIKFCPTCYRLLLPHSA